MLLLLAWRVEAEDPATRMMELMLDMMELFSGVDIDRYDEWRDRVGDGRSLPYRSLSEWGSMVPGGGYSPLGFNSVFNGFSLSNPAMVPLGLGGGLPAFSHWDSLLEEPKRFMSWRDELRREPSRYREGRREGRDDRDSYRDRRDLDEREPRYSEGRGGFAREVAPYSGYEGLDGVWLSPSGERWLVQQNQFILYHGSGGGSEGVFRVRDDKIIAQVVGSSRPVIFQFRQMDDLLLLRSDGGQIMLLQRGYANLDRKLY
ncbi:hypothetical protein D5085_11775 [Ectothiorhodospiraceae bacterium BW-2]|nr:hypothetical protein D5085_11775 [Ectothiorhodospiraceae bacterium BW-2]